MIDVLGAMVCTGDGRCCIIVPLLILFGTLLYRFDVTRSDGLMDAGTLVVGFLLVVAAALACYLLSQWRSIRHSTISIGWLVISIGTTLLLAAAGVVVLTVGLLPELRLSPTKESADPMRRSTQSVSGSAEGRLDRAAPTKATTATIRAAAPTDRGGGSAAGESIAEGDSEHRNEIETASALSSLQSLGARRHAESTSLFSAADPWAATRCVYAFNPDPADRTRWRIENECGAPVGVLFASCSKSPQECRGSQSTSWEYPPKGMVLPGKLQRTVTDEEETRYGSQIRYVACLVATWGAIDLIGEGSEVRSSPSWLEQFDAARNGDECLMQVQKWSDAGRSSGQSIDLLLLGSNPPGSVHPGAASEP